MVNLFGKKEAECTTVGTDDAGNRKMVCKVSDGKIVNVTVKRDGSIDTQNEFSAVTPDEYKKIHKAITESV